MLLCMHLQVFVCFIAKLYRFYVKITVFVCFHITIACFFRKFYMLLHLWSTRYFRAFSDVFLLFFCCFMTFFACFTWNIPFCLFFWGCRALLVLSLLLSFKKGKLFMQNCVFFNKYRYYRSFLCVLSSYFNVSRGTLVFFEI